MRENALTNGGGELFTPGGFEIMISASVVAQRRDHLLAAWRQACFAMHGLHVTDRNQIVKDPVLSDGTPMTMEIRQAIAAARVAAGTAYSVDAHRAGTLNYVKDVELDGVLPKQDWERSFAYVESTLGPPRVVKAKELETPPGELQLRLNLEYLDLIKNDVLRAETMAMEHLSVWTATNTRRMSWWKPTVVEPDWFEHNGIRAKYPAAPDLHTVAVHRVVDFTKLQASGQTFRAWFQRRVAAALAESLDLEFHRAVDGLTRTVRVSTIKDLLAAPGSDAYRVWMLDPSALEHVGAGTDEVIVPSMQGIQYVWDLAAYPFRERFAFARETEAFEKTAMHVEFENPFKVEITPARDDDGAVRPGCYDVMASYVGAIFIPDHAAQHCMLAYLA